MSVAGKGTAVVPVDGERGFDHVSQNPVPRLEIPGQTRARPWRRSYHACGATGSPRRSSDVPAAAASLVRAFHDDPMLAYMFPIRTDPRSGPAPFLQAAAPPDLHEERTGLHDRGVPVDRIVDAPLCRSAPDTRRDRTASHALDSWVGGREPRSGSCRLVESRHPQDAPLLPGWARHRSAVARERPRLTAVMAPVLEICDREGHRCLSRVLQGEQRRLLQPPRLRSHR